MSAGTQLDTVDHKRVVGNAIRGRREQLGLTQKQLAARVLELQKAAGDKPGGLEATHVSRWERGMNAPAGRRLSWLAEALDTTIPDLLGAQPPPEPPDTADLRRLVARLDRRLARIERLLESRNGNR